MINADAESIQSIKVTNSLAERLGMNEEQLFKYAAENTRRILPPRIRNMNDVMKVLYFSFGRLIMWIFYAAMEELVELGVIECTNPEVEHSRTEKGERVLGLL